MKMTGNINNSSCFYCWLLIVIISFPFAAETAQAANIICFGDSITSGYGSTTGGYPPKLDQLLQEHGKPALIINSSIPGERTPEGANRLAEVLKTSRADIMLIMEGTNDVRRGLSLGTTQRNLDAIIKQAKAAGVVPIVATLTPSNQGKSPKLIPAKWNPMIKSLAAENKVILSDHYQKILKDWTKSTVDGIHPNDDGYTLIAQIWYETIADLISSDGSVIHPDDDPHSFLSSVFAGVSGKEKYLYLLRELRLRYLQPTTIGRKVVAVYTLHSQPWAEFILQHDVLRVLTRIALYPLVGVGYILVKLTLPIQITITILSLSVILAAAITFGKRKRSGAQLLSMPR